MAFDTPSPVTESTQEVRLATTMTGGVSLAVWMAGVAREINLLAQASQWRWVGGKFPTDSTLTGPAAESLRLYAELINLLDVVVDIDILSGTSAGGINAAFIGWSRVRGCDLGGLRELWLNLGALTELLRNPTDKFTPSLLYGDEQMFSQLAEHIPSLPSGPFPPEALPKDAPQPSTTLYVTTTLLDPETSRFTDSYGTLVQDVNRRGIFTFTEEDLAMDDTAEALALAARSSASFPAAFEPSFIPFKKGTPQTARVPARPPMERFANITRPHWVADGGLLDNQPIDVLLNRIFDRHAERPVRRVLLFVVPSTGPAPDLVQAPAPDDVNEPLGLVDGLLKDVVAVTTQSIAADLRRIRNHQDRMEARTDGRLRLAELATRPPQSRLLTRSLLDDYQTREATKQAQDLGSALLRQLSTWPPESSNSPESIPKGWEAELAIGGDAEKLCRQNITASMRSQWSTPRGELPDSAADLALYGQAAFDLAKGCALAVVQAAYQLANTGTHFTDLSELSKGIHGAYDPPAAPNVPELVRKVCTDPAVRQGSLAAAATQVAENYLSETAVSADAWRNLGEAFVKRCATLRGLVLAGSSDAGARKQDQVAAGQLSTYLNYLMPEADYPEPEASRLEPEDISSKAQAVAMKLFDLAATQRAMLPVEADIEQPLEFIQVSADTRSLLAPDSQTAQQKLTGMQLHHFGAFYKRSWRANDWMWGRLDGAGWLVHVLLDPQRVRRIVEERDEQSEKGSHWFLRKLHEIGAPDVPEKGYPLPAADGRPTQYLTEAKLIEELGFLDETSEPIPSSIPLTALWLAQAWQRRVLDEELEVLANTVIQPQLGMRPDWSPTESVRWAERVVAAKQHVEQTRVGQTKEPDADKAEATKRAADEYYALLKRNPVAKETFASDKGSPLMARTVTHAAATASAAVGSVQQLPHVVKPPLTTLRTMTLGGYRVVSSTKGVARWSIIAGAMLLLVGAVFAIKSSTVFGMGGLAVAAIGGYLVVLATWQRSSRMLFAGLALTLMIPWAFLALKCVRDWLFGDKARPGVVGAHMYLLGTQWWYPLALVIAIPVIIAALAEVYPDRRRRAAKAALRRVANPRETKAKNTKT
jgi:patatin-related protein